MVVAAIIRDIAWQKPETRAEKEEALPEDLLPVNPVVKEAEGRYPPFVK